MKILVMGGTRYFGKHLVMSLIDEGHHVTIGTRGNLDFLFKDKVTFIQADRSKLEDLKKLSEQGPYDLIYDQICVSAQNAMDSIKAFNGRCHRYILASTGSVYNPIEGSELVEENFNQEKYLINLEDTNPYDYQEAKRQAEAVFSKMAQFPVVMVRLPIVLGKDDYSGRLKFHVNAVQKGEEIYFPNLMSRISFIQSHDAGRFLHFIGRQKFTGAVNAVSSGSISLFDLMAMIEKAVGKRALFAKNESPTNHSPFGFENDFIMSKKLGLTLGFDFEELDCYISPLINSYLE